MRGSARSPSSGRNPLLRVSTRTSPNAVAGRRNACRGLSSCEMTRTSVRRALLAGLPAPLFLACLPSPAVAALPGAKISAAQLEPVANYPGIQHLHYETGPLAIEPGQNSIDYQPTAS